MAEPFSSDFTLLGVTRECTKEQVHKAFRQCSLLKHPDKFPHASEEERNRLADDFAALQHSRERVLQWLAGEKAPPPVALRFPPSQAQAAAQAAAHAQNAAAAAESSSRGGGGGSSANRHTSSYSRVPPRFGSLPSSGFVTSAQPSSGGGGGGSGTSGGGRRNTQNSSHLKRGHSPSVTIYDEFGRRMTEYSPAQPASGPPPPTVPAPPHGTVRVTSVSSYAEQTSGGYPPPPAPPDVPQATTTTTTYVYSHLPPGSHGQPSNTTMQYVSASPSGTTTTTTTYVHGVTHVQQPTYTTGTAVYVVGPPPTTSAPAYAYSTTPTAQVVHSEMPPSHQQQQHVTYAPLGDAAHPWTPPPPPTVHSQPPQYPQSTHPPKYPQYPASVPPQYPQQAHASQVPPPAGTGSAEVTLTTTNAAPYEQAPAYPRHTVLLGPPRYPQYPQQPQQQLVPQHESQAQGQAQQVATGSYCMGPPQYPQSQSSPQPSSQYLAPPPPQGTTGDRPMPQPTRQMKRSHSRHLSPEQEESGAATKRGRFSTSPIGGMRPIPIAGLKNGCNRTVSPTAKKTPVRNPRLPVPRNPNAKQLASPTNVYNVFNPPGSGGENEDSNGSFVSQTELKRHGSGPESAATFQDNPLPVDNPFAPKNTNPFTVQTSSPMRMPQARRASQSSTTHALHGARATSQSTHSKTTVSTEAAHDGSASSTTSSSGMTVPPKGTPVMYRCSQGQGVSGSQAVVSAPWSSAPRSTKERGRYVQDHSTTISSVDCDQELGREGLAGVLPKAASKVCPSTATTNTDTSAVASHVPSRRPIHCGGPLTPDAVTPPPMAPSPPSSGRHSSFYGNSAQKTTPPADLASVPSTASHLDASSRSHLPSRRNSHYGGSSPVPEADPRTPSFSRRTCFHGGSASAQNDLGAPLSGPQGAPPPAAEAALSIDDGLPTRPRVVMSRRPSTDTLAGGVRAPGTPGSVIPAQPQHSATWDRRRLAAHGTQDSFAHPSLRTSQPTFSSRRVSGSASEASLSAARTGGSMVPSRRHSLCSSTFPSSERTSHASVQNRRHTAQFEPSATLSTQSEWTAVPAPRHTVYPGSFTTAVRSSVAVHASHKRSSSEPRHWSRTRSTEHSSAEPHPDHPLQAENIAAVENEGEGYDLDHDLAPVVSRKRRRPMGKVPMPY